jgi:hypothetical protein
MEAFPSGLAENHITPRSSVCPDYQRLTREVPEVLYEDVRQADFTGLIPPSKPDSFRLDLMRRWRTTKHENRAVAQIRRIE